MVPRAPSAQFTVTLPFIHTCTPVWRPPPSSIQPTASCRGSSARSWPSCSSRASTSYEPELPQRLAAVLIRSCYGFRASVLRRAPRCTARRSPRPPPTRSWARRSRRTSLPLAAAARCGTRSRRFKRRELAQPWTAVEQHEVRARPPAAAAGRRVGEQRGDHARDVGVRELINHVGADDEVEGAQQRRAAAVRCRRQSREVDLLDVDARAGGGEGSTRAGWR